MKINIYSWVSRMSYAFQYTTIKMIIFYACKNLLNNKKNRQGYHSRCVKRP